MVGRHVKGVAFGLVVVFFSSVLVACTSKAPRAQFVGIPEAVERTPDLELPLKDKDREAILNFMLNAGRRPLPWWSRADVDPGLLEDVQEEYGRLLHALSERAPATVDLEEDGELAKYFDAPKWVLSVHDARVGKDNDGEYYDLDSQRARALVKGDFVFAFYARRLMPVTVTKDQVPALEPREGTVWVLEDRKGVTYTGLVIFHKHYAIPIGGESR